MCLLTYCLSLFIVMYFQEQNLQWVTTNCDKKTMSPKQTSMNLQFPVVSCDYDSYSHETLMKPWMEGTQIHSDKARKCEGLICHKYVLKVGPPDDKFILAQ